MSLIIRTTPSNEYVHTASVITATYPFAMSIWFNPYVEAETVAQHLFNQADDGINNQYIALVLRGDLSIPIDNFLQFTIRSGTSQSADTTNPFIIGKWNHAFGASTSAQSRVVLNGDFGNAATKSHSSGIPTNMDSVAIGILNRSSQAGECDGRFAHGAIWTGRIPGDNEVALLTKGVRPDDHRITPPVWYAPLTNGSLIDIIGGVDLTTIGGTPEAAEEPSIFYSLPSEFAADVAGGDQAVTTNLASVTATAFQAGGVATGTAPVTLNFASATATAFQAGGVATGSAPVTLNLASVTAIGFQAGGVATGSAPVTLNFASATAVGFQVDAVLAGGSQTVTTNLASVTATAFQAGGVGTGTVAITLNLASVTATAFQAGGVATGTVAVTLNLASVTAVGFQVGGVATGSAPVTTGLATVDAVAFAVATAGGTPVTFLDASQRVQVPSIEKTVKVPTVKRTIIVP